MNETNGTPISLQNRNVVTLDLATELRDTELPQLLEPGDLHPRPAADLAVGGGEAALENAVPLPTTLRCEVLGVGAPASDLHGH